MDHQVPSASPRHIPPASNKQQDSHIATPKLGDFAKLLSSPNTPSASSEQSQHTAGHDGPFGALPPYETTPREDTSLLAANTPARLGNFSKIFNVLKPQPTSVLASEVHSISRKQNDFNCTSSSVQPAQPQNELATDLGTEAPASEINKHSFINHDSPRGNSSAQAAQLDGGEDLATLLSSLAPAFDSDYGASTSTSDTVLPAVFDKPMLPFSSDSDYTDSDHDSEYYSHPSIPKPPQGQQIFIYQNPPRTGSRKTVYDFMRSKAEKHEQLCYKMLAIAPDEEKAGGIHVFLDTSNITIGFKKNLMAKYKIPDQSSLKPIPRLNISFLHEILVRHRNVEGLMAGCSTLPGMPGQYYVHELSKLGYKVDLRNRQIDPAPSTKDNRAPARDRYVESLVDETIQARMGETIMEYNKHPGTIIIATGDAKPAPFSAGFYHYARWALELDWNVEVVAWSSTLSKTWINPEFCKRWGKKFRVINLDAFLDELFECYND